jgi:hypothetical protein
MNRYNEELRKVEPAQSATYAITPAQAQQLERMTQPTAPIISVPGQTSTTSVDVSAIFEPLPVKEQFTPVERALGFMLRSALFVIAALIISLAAAWKMELGRVDWFFSFAVCLLITLLLLNRQEVTHSAAGLAMRHQDAAQDALHTIVASNETVALQRLENEDKAHEREITLRREMLQTYVKQIGGGK